MIRMFFRLEETVEMSRGLFSSVLDYFTVGLLFTGVYVFLRTFQWRRSTSVIGIGVVPSVSSHVRAFENDRFLGFLVFQRDPFDT